MVDDEGWSLIAVWVFVGFLVGSKAVIVTDGSDYVTCTNSGATVSTTGSGIAFCGEFVV